MRRDNFFWGTALILLGGLFFLKTEGVILSVFPYLWPIALILFGGWMILSVFWKAGLSESEMVEIALQGARNVHYHFSHGAGQIDVIGGAPMGKALVGSSAAGMNYSGHLSGDKLNVKVEAGPSFLPFIGPAEGAYRFQITQEVPASIKLETGASQLNLDLRNVLANQIELETGASSSHIILPARGASILDIEAGAASINISVPEGVACRIRMKDGFSSLNVDQSRFPQVDGRLYQSPDFETAANRAEINIEAGAASITIK